MRVSDYKNKLVINKNEIRSIDLEKTLFKLGVKKKPVLGHLVFEDDAQATIYFSWMVEEKQIFSTIEFCAKCNMDQCHDTINLLKRSFSNIHYNYSFMFEGLSFV